MPFTKITSVSSTDMENNVDNYSVDTATTDGATSQKKNEWMNTNWTQDLGYYKTLPEVSVVIDAKANWTMGKGFKADEIVTMILMQIGEGTGKDTFNTILENMIRTYHIGGDAYAHIIRNKKKQIINIKPLNPETMAIKYSGGGIIEGYEQKSKFVGKKSKKYDPEDIFHLSRNRVADEIHGQSMVRKLAEIILMKNEAMDDWKTMLHRNVKPIRIWYVDTDDTAEISAFKTKVDAVNNDTENLIVPKGSVETEIAAVPANATLNAIPWIEMLDDKFYEAAAVPKIVVGGTGAITDAAVKIAYLAFQQTIEEEQLFVEEQVLKQLGLEIELEFPASLENDMLSDQKKDEENGAMQPNDVAQPEGEATPPQMAGAKA